jgi:4-amino-4-deoxy-L-arabinose transferase-like glycosyltransferase
MLKEIQKYIIRHKVEIGILIVILLVAAVLRLYRISDYMTFLGDEGRDAIVAKDILQGNFTLLGPRASAGDFFLGPIYYYLMAPFLFLTNLDPVGPAIMVALFGIATVFLVYYVGLKFFNEKAGLMAASLYAVSPLVIAYSRSSWNPNLMPFFSLLMLYLLYFGVKKQKDKVFFLVGLLLGIAMQLHYLSVFLGVIIFMFVLLGELMLPKKKIFIRYVTHYGLLFVGFIVGLSPFLAFEIRHGFQNTRTIFKFIFEDNAAKVYLPHHSFVNNALDVFFRLFGRLVTMFPPPEQISASPHPYLQLWQIVTIIIALCAIGVLLFIKDKLKVLLLGLWLFFGVFLFGIYKQAIYDYYFGFMFPLPFLLVGGFLSKSSDLKKYKRLGILISICIFTGLMLFNLSGNPFRYIPNKQKDQAKHNAEFILSKTNNQPFNFALITDGNSDHVYRYFFEIENRAPVTILNPNEDPERKSVTQQLLVVCEIQNCQPLGNSLWEVAGFGRAEIAGEWEIPFIKIYRLVHYEDNR